MHHVTLIVVSLVLLHALPGTASATPRCTGVFKRSCLKQLFSCFKPAGSCTTETEVALDSLQTSVTTCWENGASTVSAFHAPTRMGTLTVNTTKGTVCTKASVVSTASGVESTYVRRKRSWILRVTGDGSMTVTCPTGKVETYGIADLAQAHSGCIGRAAAPCQIGSCP